MILKMGIGDRRLERNLEIRKEYEIDREQPAGGDDVGLKEYIRSLVQ
jgi:hypothetical protein